MPVYPHADRIPSSDRVKRQIAQSQRYWRSRLQTCNQSISQFAHDRDLVAMLETDKALITRFLNDLHKIERSIPA